MERRARLSPLGADTWNPSHPFRQIASVAIASCGLLAQAVELAIEHGRLEFAETIIAAHPVGMYQGLPARRPQSWID